MAITKVFRVTNVDQDRVSGYVSTAYWRWTATDSASGYTAKVEGATSLLPLNVPYLTATEEDIVDAIEFALGDDAMVALSNSLDEKVQLAAGPAEDLPWEVPPAAEFLPATGGTMAGPINMDGNRVLNVGSAVASGDAASKAYVDAAVAAATGGEYLPISGGTMEGNIDAGGFAVRNLAAPDADGDAATKAYVDAASLAAAEAFMPKAGGTFAGEVDMGFNKIVGLADPEWPQDAAHKQYVDQAIVAAVPEGFQNRTIYIEPSPGVSTSSTLFADAMATIGTGTSSTLWTIEVGTGQYNEPGPIAISSKSQLQIVGRDAAGTTASTIKNGVAISGSTGVRLSNIQIEGTSSIATIAGLGIYASRVQFAGNLSISGTGGFIIFTDCEFTGDLTVAPSFAGVIYFVRCALSKAAGVYTLSQPSPLQVVFGDGTGIPAGMNATYSGSIVDKSNVQRQYVNNVPMIPAAADDGSVLAYSAVLEAFVPQAPSEDDTKLPLAGGTMSGNIVMDGNRVSGLPAPSEPDEAANKAFVVTRTDWVLVADVTTTTSVSLPMGFANVGEWVGNVLEGMVVAIDGTEYVSGGAPAAAVVAYPATFPVAKGGTSLCDFTFTSPLDTTFDVTVHGADRVMVFVRYAM